MIHSVMELIILVIEVGRTHSSHAYYVHGACCLLYLFSKAPVRKLYDELDHFLFK